MSEQLLELCERRETYSQNGFELHFSRLVASGADVNHQLNDGRCILQVAVDSDDAFLLRRLIRVPGLRIDNLQWRQRTALMHSKSVLVTRLLLESGANPAAMDASGNTAVHVYAYRHAYDQLAVLLASGKPINLYFAPTTPFHKVVFGARQPGRSIEQACGCVELLCASGCNIFAPSYNGTTALTVACQWQFTPRDLIQCLLKHMTQSSDSFRESFFALHSCEAAVQYDNLRALEVLLSNGCMCPYITVSSACRGFAKVVEGWSPVAVGIATRNPSQLVLDRLGMPPLQQVRLALGSTLYQYQPPLDARTASFAEALIKGWTPETHRRMPIEIRRAAFTMHLIAYDKLEIPTEILWHIIKFFT